MKTLEDFPYLHSRDFKLSSVPTDEQLQDVCDMIRSRMVGIISEQPRVSVVFPAYNEEMYLPLMLWTLSKLKTSVAVEIIGVNNVSNDRTWEIMTQSWISRIDESRKWVSYARQAWLKAAKWDILATTDADTQVPENWIDGSMKYFNEDPDLVCFSGWSEPNGWHISYWAVRTLVRMLRRRLNREISSNWSFPGHNMFYSTKIAKKLGWYTPGIDLWEDNLLARKFREEGQIFRVDDKEISVLTSARRVSSFSKVADICFDRIRKRINIVDYNDVSSYGWSFSDIR